MIAPSWLSSSLSQPQHANEMKPYVNQQAKADVMAKKQAQASADTE
jgi:hypothetical protein